MKNISVLLVSLVALFSSCKQSETGTTFMADWKNANSQKIEVQNNSFTVNAGEKAVYAGRGSKKGYRDFIMGGFFSLSKGGTATLKFHTDKSGGKGYEVMLHNGPADGTVKSGSLTAVRNLYKSVSSDEMTSSFVITVTGKHISIYINGIEVVSYVEPEVPYRTEEYRDRVLGRGNFVLECSEGTVTFLDVHMDNGSGKAQNEKLKAVDEQNDRIIRMQQAGFPVIDYHVHLKGWTKEEAHAKSMNVGINYGIAPNCGIGFPITDDEGVIAYLRDNINMPFFFGMQGEGREWVDTFSAESRSYFDYVFTDALTFHDHKNRRTRLWINDEVHVDIPQEKYMDVIVDRTLKVLNSEPIDIFVNPFFLPEAMSKDYDKLWTKERIDAVVAALKKNNIALEINARYRIPNFTTIKAAMDAGIMLTFGTNNGDPEMGKLEYCMEAVDACGITAGHMWFPSDKTVRR